jgi:SMC interacting uncharacterized protein involved in chromosome segregation
MKDNTITRYTSEVTPSIERSSSIVVDSTESLTEATALLSQLNKNLDRVKEEKEKVLKPLREAANAEKARWEPLEKMFKPAIAHLRTVISAYQTKLVQEKEAADAKLAARVGEGKGKLKAETAVRKMTETAIEDKIQTNVGGLSFRSKKQIKVIDPDQIPDQYWMIDEKAILDALTSGIPVPGCVIETIQVPVNKR